MSAQYLRQFSLIVYPPSGQGIELGALRCTFDIRRGDIQTPNSADVTIYNLSDNTANLICSPEFSQIQVKAGYGTSANLGLIFKGSIKQARKGREDQKTSYVALTAADGDEAYNFASISLTLAAGNATPGNAIEAMIDNMAEAALASPTGKPGGQALTKGYIPPLVTAALPRGRTYFGSVTDELREIAANSDSKWSIQDGALCLIPNTGYIVAGNVVTISPATGLIGVPEQTQNGLELRVLLNPSLKIGQRIQLNSTNVNQYRYGTDLQSQTLNKLLQQSATKTNADGMYYIMRANHSGDTRGNPWYTDLVCLAVDAKVPQNAVEQAAILPANAVQRY